METFQMFSLLGGWVIFEVSHTKGSSKDFLLATETSHNRTENIKTQL